MLSGLHHCSAWHAYYWAASETVTRAMSSALIGVLERFGLYAADMFLRDPTNRPSCSTVSR